MKFKAEINIMPIKALLDPQGKAVTSNLKSLNLSEIDNVRVGKYVTLEIDSPNRETANNKVEELCKKLLINPLMEHYEYTVEEI